jgi:hypothetical protein
MPHLLPLIQVCQQLCFIQFFSTHYHLGFDLGSLGPEEHDEQDADPFTNDDLEGSKSTPGAPASQAASDNDNDEASRRPANQSSEL